MAKNNKSGGAKGFFRGLGLFAIIAGLIAAAVGIALLMTDSAADEKIKFGLAIAGVAVAFVGALFVIVGVRKAKDEGAEAVPVNCMYCGEPNPPASKYCRKCGKPLVKKCVNCGAVLDMDAKYCNTCGVRVRKDS